MGPIRNTDELAHALRDRGLPVPTRARSTLTDAINAPGAGDSVRLLTQFGIAFLCIGFDENPTAVTPVTAYAVAKILVERMAPDLRTTAKLSVTGQLAESEIVKRLTRRERVATSEIEQWFQDNRGR